MTVSLEENRKPPPPPPPPPPHSSSSSAHLLEHHAHMAALKRLSARASSSSSSPSNTPRPSPSSFSPLALSAISKLRSFKVPLQPGLSDEEIVCIEARLSFCFPPDLVAILRLGLPVGAGFPDWRSSTDKQLRILLNLPIAGLLYEVAKGCFWFKSWGPRPSDAPSAVRVARSALRRHPLLLPVFRHCYIPASPNLASNPIFFVSHQDVRYCALDLADFFLRCTDFSADAASPSSASFRCDLYASSPALFSSASSPSFSSFRCPPSLPGSSKTPPPHHRFGSDRSLDDNAFVGGDSGRSDDSGGRRGFHRPQSTMTSNHNSNSESCCSSSSNSSSKPSGSSDESMDLSLPAMLECHHNSSDRFAFGSCRRIEFWSDLAERRYLGCSNVQSNENDPTCKEAETPTPSGGGGGKIGDGDTSKVEGNLIPPWLERFFDKMAMVLRNEGWKETDVADMFFLLAPPPPAAMMNRGNTLIPQIAAESLVLYVDLLSEFLRKAGWSTSDVAEAFDVDLCVGGDEGRRRRRRPVELPAHVAAKVGKLAELAAAQL